MFELNAGNRVVRLLCRDHRFGGGWFGVAVRLSVRRTGGVLGQLLRSLAELVFSEQAAQRDGELPNQRTEPHRTVPNHSSG